MKRIVNIKVDEHSPLGTWSVTCPDCPLIPHLEALGMKQAVCLAGLQTKAQGCVAIQKCNYYQPDSIATEGGVASVECTK